MLNILQLHTSIDNVEVMDCSLFLERINNNFLHKMELKGMKFKQCKQMNTKWQINRKENLMAVVVLAASVCFSKVFLYRVFGY